jgi:hypothetical protein
MPLRIDGLWVYPLKSGAPIATERVELDARGPRWDRRWMVVDADGKFVTQREEHGLARVRTALSREGLVLAAEGHGTVTLAYEPAGDRVRVRVWKDECDAVRLREASDWMSTVLGRRVSAVFMPDDADRTRHGAPVSFADAYPLLLIGRASFDDLKARVAEPLVIERFRPNVVIAGAEPYAEDGWHRIELGSVPVDIVKPCARCVITTIDPATAIAGQEPLRTLATYRRSGTDVLFGQNAIHRATGSLRIGAPVRVLE